MNKKEKADKELHLKEAKNLLLKLPTMENNIRGGSHPWKDIVKYRIQCVEEFIEYVKTEKTDHIKLEEDQPHTEIQHFK